MSKDMSDAKNWGKEFNSSEKFRRKSNKPTSSDEQNQSCQQTTVFFHENNLKENHDDETFEIRNEEMMDFEESKSTSENHSAGKDTYGNATYMKNIAENTPDTSQYVSRNNPNKKTSNFQLGISSSTPIKDKMDFGNNIIGTASGMSGNTLGANQSFPSYKGTSSVTGTATGMSGNTPGANQSISSYKDTSSNSGTASGMYGNTLGANQSFPSYKGTSSVTGTATGMSGNTLGANQSFPSYKGTSSVTGTASGMYGNTPGANQSISSISGTASGMSVNTPSANQSISNNSTNDKSMNLGWSSDESANVSHQNIPKHSMAETVVSPKLRRLLMDDPDLIKKVKYALQGKEFTVVVGNNDVKDVKPEENPVKFIEDNELEILSYDDEQKSWLQSESKGWQKLLDELEKDYNCAIYTEEDLTKTYVFAKKEDCKSIYSKLYKFVDNNPTDFEISSHVWFILNNSEQFSNLKLEKSNDGKLWIRSITQFDFARLKKEVAKMSCQSFLLTENEFELLESSKKNVLHEIEKELKVIGRQYQFKTEGGDIPMVFQLNSLTGISCIVKNDQNNFQVDSLLTMDWQKPTSDLKKIEKNKTDNYEILEYDTWDVSLNHHLHLKFLDPPKMSYSWNVIFEKCLKFLMNKKPFPHTLGITVPTKISKQLKEFYVDFFKAIQNFPFSHKRPINILLFVENSKMKNKIVNIQKDILSSEKVVHAAESQSAQAMASAELHPLMEEMGLNEPQKKKSRNDCKVEILEGLLNEQKVDVVVCSANPKLDLSLGAVSKVLLENAGKELQTECNKKGSIIFPEVAVTKGYKLPCQNIFFGNLPFKSQSPNQHSNISTFVENCLHRASEGNFSSIAFPALGTGNVGYDEKESATQMKKAIENFQMKNLPSSVQKIKIIIYPESKKKILSEFQNQFQNLKGPNDTVTQNGAESFDSTKNNKKLKDWASKSAEDIRKEKAKVSIEKDQNESKKKGYELNYTQLQWVSFYSFKKDAFDLAIKELQIRLENDVFTVELEEMKEMFIFYDLMPLVPDILEQLNSMKNRILVRNNSSEKFQSYLQEFRDQFYKEKFCIPENIKPALIKLCLEKVQQQYPIKCKIINDNKEVEFRSPDFDRVQEAVVYLKTFLALDKINSVSPDRFDKKDQSPSVFPSITSSSSQKMDPRPAITASAVAKDPSVTEKNLDIACFQTDSGVIVKVYTADILKLNVEGIVNAANEKLSHGAGIARAIINAAGDVVNKEGQAKLQKKTLDVGQVLSTSGGKLKYKNIIHAVGPQFQWHLKDYCKIKIEEAVYNSLKEANILGLKSVAIPSISSAIYGVPMDICTESYYLGVEKFLKEKSNHSLKEIHFIDSNALKTKSIKEEFAKHLKEFSMKDSDKSMEQQKGQQTPKPEQGAKNVDSKCEICLDEKEDPQLLKCEHSFCRKCLEKNIPEKCPICRIPYGIIYGDQPDGFMQVKTLNSAADGFPNTKTYCITYTFYLAYQSQIRTAYLPMTKEGDIILKMLQLAFERRLIFTIGESRTTGMQNTLTWNDIHHKTSCFGGPESYGYPDPDYFKRVTQELANQGITPDCVADRKIKYYISLTLRNP